MQRTSLETTDIFIGAFLLSQGGSLSGIRIKDGVRGIAAFQIEGENLERLGSEAKGKRQRVVPILYPLKIPKWQITLTLGVAN